MITCHQKGYFLYFWPLVLITMPLAHAQCSISGIGFALEGYTYSNVTAPDVHTCYAICKLQEPECRSINYNVNTSLCQLNNHSRLSRPDNYVESPLSLYFHSDQRVRLGSSPEVAAKSCKNILDEEESRGNGRYWVKPMGDNDTGEPYTTFCDMAGGADATFSFDLIFPVRSTDNYVLPAKVVPSLNAFTFCLWAKTDVKDWVPFSYAVGNHPNAIMIFVDREGLLRFQVLDEQSTAFIDPLNDKKWHHVCGMWEHSDGSVTLFIDGLQNMSSIGKARGSTIQGGGYFIIGQEQDVPNGGFDVEQTFVGEISHFYLWPSVLKDVVIKEMAQVCKERPHPGYVLSWIDFSLLHGDVQRRNQSACMSHGDVLSVFGEPRF